MASTSSPTRISPLRESNRSAESLTGLANPSRSFASSLTSRTSRPTGISARGAPLSLSSTVPPPFALHPHQLTKRLAPLKKHPTRPLYAFPQLVRHEDLLVARQLSSWCHTIFRIS